MKSEDTFIPLEVQNHKGILSEKANRKAVIKEENLVVNAPVKVGGLKNFPSKSPSEQIEPLIQAEEIIGVRYHCNCGESVEIHFEYESSPNMIEALNIERKDKSMDK